MGKWVLQRATAAQTALQASTSQLGAKLCALGVQQASSPPLQRQIVQEQLAPEDKPHQPMPPPPRTGVLIAHKTHTGMSPWMSVKTHSALKEAHPQWGPTLQLSPARNRRSAQQPTAYLPKMAHHVSAGLIITVTVLVVASNAQDMPFVFCRTRHCQVW